MSDNELIVFGYMTTETIDADGVYRSETRPAKPKYRYHHESGKWSQVFSFDTRAAVVPGSINPKTGILNTYRALPHER